jgi:hypothetical protein
MGRNACDLLKAGRMEPESAKTLKTFSPVCRKIYRILEPAGPNLLTVTLPYP